MRDLWGHGPGAMRPSKPDTRNTLASEQERATTMSIERAERLKRELTDKWVVVAESVPELKRFANFTGKVKTVNMNGRALVEFDGPADIGWYDIDPSFLTVVDGPRPRKQPEVQAKQPAAAKTPSKTGGSGGSGSPLDKIRAAAKPAGGSPLDKIRAGGAAGSAAAKPSSEGGSPLDKIRAAGAGKKTDEQQPAAADVQAADETPAKAQTVSSPPPASGGSPLDRIRSMGAAKKE